MPNYALDSNLFFPHNFTGQSTSRNNDESGVHNESATHNKSFSAREMEVARLRKAESKHYQETKVYSLTNSWGKLGSVAKMAGRDVPDGRGKIALVVHICRHGTTVQVDGKEVRCCFDYPRINYQGYERILFDKRSL